MRRTRRLVTGATVIAVLGLSCLAGCGAESGSDSRSPDAASGGVETPQEAFSGSRDGKARAREDVGVAGSAAVPDASGKNSGAAAGAKVPKPEVIRTADVVVEVGSLATSAARVRQVAESVGGTVSSEVTAFPEADSSVVAREPAVDDASGTAEQERRRARPGESVIVLRVPVSAFDNAITRVVGIGRQVSQSSSSQDVTADLADLGSRVKTQQASVERVRTLMAQATSLKDIVLLESELSRRQADLEALQARQASLADRAAMSTLTVTLRTPAVEETAEEDPAFLRGLKQGWDALVTSATMVLVVLGALLPIAVLVAAVALPIWWFRLRRRAPRPRAYVPAPGAAPEASRPSSPPEGPSSPPEGPSSPPEGPSSSDME
jgi:hypothetical protein